MTDNIISSLAVQADITKADLSHPLIELISHPIVSEAKTGYKKMARKECRAHIKALHKSPTPELLYKVFGYWLASGQYLYLDALVRLEKIKTLNGNIRRLLYDIYDILGDDLLESASGLPKDDDFGVNWPECKLTWDYVLSEKNEKRQCQKIFNDVATRVFTKL